MKTRTKHVRSIWSANLQIVTPIEEMSVSEFAERYRVLHPAYCSERPGRWDNTVFPHQAPLMDMAKEAIDSGKRGLVIMKSGQGGGTDLAINCMLYLKIYYPGPQLFMASIDRVAQEFGKERFGSIINDMEPLRARYIPNPRGDTMVKRFTDGKIQLSGGQSVFNLQSTPYRVVVIDELDSLVENLGGEGDPVKLAEVRMDSFTGRTLMIAYAHPTTKARGSAKIFYEQSDQRRAFVKHDCGGEFWYQWEHVRPGADPKDASGYTYVCPHCGAAVSDEERVVMMRRCVYRSVLPPEEAAKRQWIGGHFNQLMYPGKTIKSLAQRWIDCGDDDNAKWVFYNKILGEPYEPRVQTVDPQQLRKLIVVKRRPNDPDFYSRGQVPAGVRFLTSGQDSRNRELHYAIWGWGLRRAIDKTVRICGWLIDWGVIDRPTQSNGQYQPFTESEYHVFDDLIYRRKFPSVVNPDRTFMVRRCGHDIGYKPTQIPIIRYCRSFPDRAYPVKGAAIEATSQSTAPYCKPGTAIKHRAGETTIEDEASRSFNLNTYLLKTEFYGWVSLGRCIEVADTMGGETLGTKMVPHLSLPEDVDETWVEQTQAEQLRKGKRPGELVWGHQGPNHLADCNTYAQGMMHDLDIFSQNLTDEEAQARRAAPVRFAPPRQQSHDPSMG